MFTYRLHLEDGSDLGEATYAGKVQPGEVIFFEGRPFLVLAVAPIEDEASPLSGLLQVKAA